MKEPIQLAAYFYNELVAYEYFVSLSERHWVDDLTQYKVILNTEDENLTHKFDYRVDLWAKLSDEYPQYQRKAYLVMLLAMFEDFLNQFSLSIQEFCGLSISIDSFDSKDFGIERAKHYITKATPLDFPSDMPEWNNLKSAQKIRNVIVHAAGHIDIEKHKKQVNIVSTTKYLDSETYAREHLILSSQYILELVYDMKSFSERLIALSEKLPCN